MEDKFVNGLKQIEYKGKVREFERIRNEALKLCCDIWYDIINVNVESVSDGEYLDRTTFLRRIENNGELEELGSLIEEYQNNVNSSYYKISYDDKFIVFDYGSSIKFLVIKRKED